MEEPDSYTRAAPKKHPKYVDWAAKRKKEQERQKKALDKLRKTVR